MSWAEDTTESFCLKILGGGTPSTKRAEFYGGSIPWVRTQEVVFEPICSTEMTITDSGLRNSSAIWVPAHSVIVAMFGASAGRLAINKIPVTTNQACCNLVIDSDKGDYRFVFYALWSRYRELESRARGAAQNNLNMKIVREFRIPKPPLQVQARISATLSAYDDLIENNRRRIQLLEESAQLLYKEWFVHLRFPGHEHTTITDGVPEGWERRPLFDEAVPTYGHAFKSREFNEDGIGLPVVRIRNIPKSHSSTYTTEVAPDEKLLHDGDLVIGMDGDFHVNFWYGGKAWINQRVVRISQQGRLNAAFLRYAIEKPINDFNETISGTTVAHLGAKHLKLIEVLVPDGLVLNEALRHFETIQQQLVVLHHQISAAAKARDLLLPRLMSGEVAV